MKVNPLTLLMGSGYRNISKSVENCSTDKVSHSGPSIYYHNFGIAIVSDKNRVFFRIFLHFEIIQNIPVRHSKIIYISGVT